MLGCLSTRDNDCDCNSLRSDGAALLARSVNNSDRARFDFSSNDASARSSLAFVGGKGGRAYDSCHFLPDNQRARPRYNTGHCH